MHIHAHSCSLMLIHAHSCPLENDDYENREKYSSVDQMRQARDSQITTPHTLQQSRQYLENKANKDNQESAHRAFELARQYEESVNKEKKWWSQLKQIT